MSPDAASELEATVEVLGGGCGVVSLDGELHLYTVGELKAGLSALERAGVSRVAVDLSETRFVDSVALGVLMRAQRQLAAVGGALHLVSICPDLARTLTIAGLDDVLRPHRDVETAFAASAFES